MLITEFHERSWARNEGALFCYKRAMETQPLLKVTIPNLVDEKIIIVSGFELRF